MQEQEETERQGDYLPLAGTKSVKRAREDDERKRDTERCRGIERERGRKVLCGRRNQTARIAISAYF